jgi:polysaccharide biosynthesis protein PslH
VNGARRSAGPGRILLCASQLPLPPLNGLRLPFAVLLDELRSRGYEVRALGFLKPDQDEEAAHAAGFKVVRLSTTDPVGRAASLVRAVATRRPMWVDRMSTRLRAALAAEIADHEPDVIQVVGSELASLGRMVEGHPSVLCALDAMHLNVEGEVNASRGVRQRLLQGELERVKRFEASEYRRFGRVVVVSDQDREALAVLDPAMRLAVIPNGVDVNYYRPNPDLPRGPNLIVLHGTMDFGPNVEAAEFLATTILPTVRLSVPDARVAIVGRSPSDRVRALAMAPGVEVTGDVPDVRPWLQSCAVYVCPMLSGTGVKNKLLEAMASEAPCVVSSRALRGLSVKQGCEVLVGEHTEELVSHIVRVFGDAALASDLGRAARRYVADSHSWRAVADRYERVLRDVRHEASGNTRPPTG